MTATAPTEPVQAVRPSCCLAPPGSWARVKAAGVASVVFFTLRFQAGTATWLTQAARTELAGGAGSWLASLGVECIDRAHANLASLAQSGMTLDLIAAELAGGPLALAPASLAVKTAVGDV